MKNRKKIFKIAGITIAVIAILLVAWSFLFSFLAKQKIREAQFGSYKLESEKIETNLFRRQVTLTNAKLTSQNSNNNIIVPEATVSGIKLLHLLLNSEIAVKSFEVSGPTIHYFKKKKQQKTASDSSNTKSSSGKRVIKVGHLDISDVLFYYQKQQQNQPDTVFSTLFDLDVWDLSTDSTTNSEFHAPFFNFNRIELIADKGELKVAKGLYKLNFSELSFDSDHPNLVVTQAKFISPYSKYEIGRQTGVETDWYNIQIDSIGLNAIKLAQSLEDTALILGMLSIKNIDAEIFRDKRLPFPEKPDTKLPAELVQSIPFGLHSDSLIIQHADIEYEERAEESKQAGMVTFNSLNAKIKDLSNINRLKKGPMTLSAGTEVMNMATLNAEFIFSLPGAKQPSQVTGSLEPTILSIFNPMTKPYVGLEIQSGESEQLDFNFGYNDVSSNGDMIFEYKNLDFVMLNNNNDSKKLIVTFLAKKFVVREQNLHGNDSYKKGEITFVRNRKKSVFSYWWKSLLNGLKSVAVTL